LNTGVRFLAGCVVIVLTAIGAAWTVLTLNRDMAVGALPVVPYVVAAGIAFATASVELLKKYSVGTSVAALANCAWTWLYLVVNVGAAVCALYLIKSGSTPDGSGIVAAWGRTGFAAPLVAGFGSMMVLRSSFITVRTHGRDHPVGPALILDALQDQLEHRIDQARAASSLKEVREVMIDVDPSRSGIEITTLALHMLERCPRETQESLRKEIDRLLREKNLSDAAKAIAIGISVRKVAGIQVLREVAAVLSSNKVVPAAKPSAANHELYTALADVKQQLD
jgi:hypothetical protein